MADKTIIVRDRQACPYCFRTLDPAATDPQFQSFVQCTTCAAVYHASCHAKLQACVHSPDGRFVCDGDAATAVTLKGSPPPLPTPLRTPVSFGGLASSHPLAAPQADKPQQAEAKPPAPAKPPAQPAPEASAPAPGSPPPPIRAAAPKPAAAALVTPRYAVLQYLAAALAVFIYWLLPWYPARAFEADIVLEMVQGSPLLVPYVLLGAFALTLALLSRPLLQSRNAFLRSVLPFALLALALLFIVNLAEITLTSGRTFDAEVERAINFMMSRFTRLPSNPTLGLLAGGFALAIMVAGTRAAFWSRALLGVLLVAAAGIAVVNIQFYGRGDEVWLLGSSMAFGVAIWLPRLFLPDPQGAASNPPQRGSISAETPEHLKKRGIAFRTVGLALPIVAISGSLLFTFSGGTNLDSPLAAQIYGLGLVYSLVLSYIFNRVIIQPTLDRRLHESVWRRGARALLIGGVASVLASAVYQLALQELFDLNAFWGVTIMITLGGVGTIVSLIMTISAATGETHRNKVIKALRYQFFFTALAGIVIELIDTLNTQRTVDLATSAENIFVVAVGVAISSLFYTIPTWLADYFAKGDYGP